MFLGPSGSGKSEIALNLAIRAAGDGGPPVHFFDMDQTKPLFRSREARDAVERSGAVFHSGLEFLDSPVLPDGVSEFLWDEGIRCFLDMGGSVNGARSLGQCLPDAGGLTRALYVVNVYRPFSDERSFLEDLSAITAAARLSSPRIVSNPNLGGETTLEDVKKGHGRLLEILERKGLSLAFLTVRAPLLEAASEWADCPVEGLALRLSAG
ncbi:MAG: ATP-binding protein [Aminobacteriaceae bacterium]